MVEPAPALADLFEAQRGTALAWRTSGPAERVRRIGRLLAALHAHRPAMLEAAAADFRRPPTEVVLTEMVYLAREARCALRNTARWMRPRRRLPTLVGVGTSACVVPQPRGRALIISPWNYPYALTFGPLISALAAGCPAIVKPSEYTPAHAAAMRRIVAEVFAPEEVALVEGGADTACALLELPFAHTFFTGSPAIGRSVMAAAARHLGSVTLELGGKSPVIIDASADLEQAARVVMASKFINNGQTCVAPDHLYVDRRVRAAFLAHCSAWLRASFGATAEDRKRSPDLARAVSVRHCERLCALLRQALELGAEVLEGGEADPAERFIAPTLLTGVPESAALMQEEIFGPILPVIEYDDAEAVIAAVNRGPAPLALYVWSREPAFARRIVEQTSSGGACINHCLIQFAHGNVPFGGVNGSGIGNAHGHWGFLAFSHERAVVRNRIMVADKLLAPYDRLKRRAIDWLAR